MFLPSFTAEVTTAIISRTVTVVRLSTHNSTQLNSTRRRVELSCVAINGALIRLPTEPIFFWLSVSLLSDGTKCAASIFVFCCCRSSARLSVMRVDQAETVQDRPTDTWFSPYGRVIILVLWSKFMVVSSRIHPEQQHRK